MEIRELQALISLLDDTDDEVQEIVGQKLRSLGEEVIPLLESYWEQSGFNPLMQKRIEDLIHELQLNTLTARLLEWRDAGATDLLKGMWLVATYQYPDLTLESLQRQVDQLFYEAWLEFRHGMHPADQIDKMNYVFFRKMKFAANTRNFHSAANSMVNVLLETRRGNPISLCILYLLLGRRLGLPLYGVNLPNLFVLTYKQDHLQFYINVFNRGLVFERKDIDNFIAQLNLAPRPGFYEPCSHLEIILRVLRNLHMAFEKIGDEGRMREMQGLLDRLSPIPETL